MNRYPLLVSVEDDDEVPTLLPVVVLAKQEWWQLDLHQRAALAYIKSLGKWGMSRSVVFDPHDGLEVFELMKDSWADGAVEINAEDWVKVTEPAEYRLYRAAGQIGAALDNEPVRPTVMVMLEAARKSPFESIAAAIVAVENKELIDQILGERETPPSALDFSQALAPAALPDNLREYTITLAVDTPCYTTTTFFAESDEQAEAIIRTMQDEDFLDFEPEWENRGNFRATAIACENGTEHSSRTIYLENKEVFVFPDCVDYHSIGLEVSMLVRSAGERLWGIGEFQKRVEDIVNAFTGTITGRSESEQE